MGQSGRTASSSGPASWQRRQGRPPRPHVAASRVTRTAAGLVDDLAMRWVFFYTRRLPARIAYPRRDEVASDLWEHRHDARTRGMSDLATAVAIIWRMIRGAPADVGWRFVKVASAQGRTVEVRLTEEAAVTITRASRLWVSQRMRSRKCKACGNRYGRRLPNCPVCKTHPGFDGIEKKPRGIIGFAAGGSDWGGAV